MATTCDLTLTETLTKPFAEANTEVQAAYLSALQDRPHFKVLPVKRNHFIHAASIRDTMKAKTPDAIHITVGEDGGCDAFVTNDRDWRSYTDRDVFLLQECL